MVIVTVNLTPSQVKSEPIYDWLILNKIQNAEIQSTLQALLLLETMTTVCLLEFGRVSSQ